VSHRRDASMKHLVHAFRATAPTFHGRRFAAQLAPKPGAKPRAADAAPVGELYLYDAIGSGWFGGIAAADVVAALEELKKAGAGQLNLYVNSPGGDVFEATAIYSVLRRWTNGPVHGFVDGLAASAASYLVLAAEHVTTAFNAMWMIHNPWGIVIGDEQAMRKSADDLHQIGATLVDTYVAATGQTAEDVRAWMDAETWMSASEALERGFTDAVTEKPEEDEEDEEDEETAAAASASAATSLLARYGKTPAALRPAAGTLITSMEQRLLNLPKRASPPTRRPGQPGK
jgi:ATP-dependent Clp protease protease subunit